jgi:L-lactate dehydrogenase (cytochrome)
LKGILDPDDALAAVAAGVDVIVVSNHGGRQLDGVPSSAAALPSVVEAVSNRITVLTDGGIRSGLDIVRMLALGAKGVLIGRAWAYALAGRGERGVSHVLNLLEAEMKVAMALMGVTNVGAIGRDNLVTARMD